MSCPIDHTTEEVRAKLKEQKPFLPVEIAEKTSSLLDKNLSQETLNEVFHLLKKYDLSDEGERNKRNHSFNKLFTT